MKEKMITETNVKIIRTAAVLLIALAAAILLSVSYVSAESAYITDVRAASGKGAYDKLEKAGYSVLSTGLHITSSRSKQTYIGYKTGDGAPVRGLICGTGSADGISYKSAGAADLYYTKDKKAGEPLVGIDVLRPDTEKGKNPPTITNDGSEIVRDKEGKPADMQGGDKTVYIAQIRAGSVKPYISEIVSVRGSDKNDAVMKAATYGYNYYAEGDIDGSDKYYTILAYERTADPEEAVTSMVAISKDLLGTLIKSQNGENEEPEPEPEENPSEEEEQEEQQPESDEEQEEEYAPDDESSDDAEQAEGEDQEGNHQQDKDDQDQSEETEQAEEDSEESSDTADDYPETDEADDQTGAVEPEIQYNGDAIDIAGIEYDRMSSKAVEGKNTYYLYTTKDKNAGNPLTMLYAGSDKTVSETTLGIWAHGYFTAMGVTKAYGYIANEEALKDLESSQEVYVKKPVEMIENTGDETLELGVKLIKVSFLTQKEGLPEDNFSLNGLIDPEYEAPDIVENDRDNPESDLPASAFGTASFITIMAGIMIAAYIFIRARSKKKKTQDRTK